MVIKYHLSPYPSLAEDMIVKVWEAASDNIGAEVYQETLAQPHTAPRTITINGMDTVVHIVRLYTAGGTKLHEYSIEPTTDTVTAFDPISFKIGDGGANTPAVGANQYWDARLAGLGDGEYLVWRNGYGFLIPNLHYANNSTTGGGFALLQVGDVFGDNEEFLIQRNPTVSNVISDSVVGKWFAGFLDVPANAVFAPTDLRKLIRFGGTCEYAFNVAPPIGFIFCFNNPTAANIGTVKFNNAPLKRNGATQGSIAIQPKCEGAFVFDGSYWNVVYLTVAEVSTTPQRGTILYIGEQKLPDIPAGDGPAISVNHGQNIAGDYTVICSIRSTQTSKGYDNNLLCPVWWHSTIDKANSFVFSIEEYVGGVQNATLVYFLIKL